VTWGVPIEDEFDRDTAAPSAAIPGFSAVLGSIDAVPGWVVPGYVDDGIPASGGGGLGVASSGQSYTSAGTWQIEQTTTPFAIFGSSVELPMYQAEDANTRFEFIKHYTAAAGNQPTIFGLNGKDTTGLQIEIFQPTRFFVNATTNVQNGDMVEDHILRFYVMAHEQGSGSWEWARQSNIWSQSADAGTGSAGNGGPANANQVQVIKQRNGATMGVFYFPASYDAPIIVELCWGYTIGDSPGGATTGNNIAVRNQNMVITAAYSPSYSESYSTTKRSRWTTSNVTRAAYRRSVSTAND
jgi:hypothetical protein